MAQEKTQQEIASLSQSSEKKTVRGQADKRQPENPVSCTQTEESKAGFVAGMVASILLTAIALFSHLTQITFIWIFATILVALIGGVLVYAWPALVKAPHPGATRAAMGSVWAIGVTLSLVSADRLVYLVPIAVFLSYVAEMCRHDDRANLLESVSLTFAGCVAIIGTVVWTPPLYSLSHGALLVTTCCALMIGTLGRYNAGQPMHIKNKHAMWPFIVRSMLSAGIGALAGCYTLVANEFDGREVMQVGVWVALLAVVFGLVAGCADYACRHVTDRKASLALGLLPVSALGFIFYGIVLLELAGVTFLS